jgi:DUF4097 and DUF4098 domain-containing protein YvlB
MTVRHHQAAACLAVVLCAAVPAAAQQRPHDVEIHVLLLATQVHEQPQVLAQVRPQRPNPQQIAERARQERERWPEVTAPFSRIVPLGRNGTLDLENLAGDVIITGGRGNEVRIEAVKRVRNPIASQARSLLEQLRIDVVERGGNVDVRTLHPMRARNMFGTVDYTIVVPSSSNVTVRTMTGDVRVTNVNGELRAEAVNGNVAASDVRRVRLVKTMTGNIELADAEADELTASTMSGDLVVSNAKGRFFDMQSVTGHLRLMNVEPDRAHLLSMQGDIEYHGRFVPSGRYEFQSHGGNIRLTPTNNQGFDIQASTFGGIFRSDYALKTIADTASRSRRGSRTIHATFGDAGAAITAHSMNGNIVIVRR